MNIIENKKIIGDINQLEKSAILNYSYYIPKQQEIKMRKLIIPKDNLKRQLTPFFKIGLKENSHFYFNNPGKSEKSNIVSKIIIPIKNIN